MNTILPSPQLRWALAADAVVSGAVAVLQIAAPGWLAGLTGLPTALLSGTGLFLVGYALMLVAMARAATLPAALVQVVVIGNVSWALGCVLIWSGSLVAPNVLGGAWLVAHMVAVLVFAALEFSGLRASSSAARA